MDRDRATAVRKVHERELRTAGVVKASLFGSLARGENPAHDIDVAVLLGESFSGAGLDHFCRLDDLEHRSSEILGKVDLVEEPVRKPRFQQEIDRDSAIAY